MRILYAGDSEIGGPANYLAGILKFIRADFVHVPPSKTLSSSLFKRRYDAVILSDFSRRQTPLTSQQAIAKQVEEGAGFLMVGGWGSFAGPYGGWRNSLIEKILPVTCLNRDDRLNIPGGALIRQRGRHPLFRSLSFRNPPVICGLNRVNPRKKSRVLLTAKRMVDGAEFPLLVINSDPNKRVAALATDLAPHWSGGLVDWGRRRVKIRVKREISIEVGDRYVRWVSCLLKWLVGR